MVSILANDYAACGWQAEIGLLLSGGVEYELCAGVNTLDFSGTSESRIRRVPFWLKKIRHYLKTEKPDLVVSFVARINVLVLLASLGTKTKVFVSERNDPRYDGRGMLSKWMVRLLYPLSNGIVFQTEQVKSLFCQKIQSKGTVIPNPISVKTRTSEPKRKKIVTVGRLTAQKNHAMLIRAFSEVVKQYPEYCLEIYGKGELEEKTAAYINELGMSEHVFLCGNHLNIHEKTADAELFVLSSDYEGLSNALLEAMMMGLPCISTRCAGAEEYIADNENGKLVPVADADAMKKAILYMIEHPAERKKMGERAEKTSELFSKECVLKQWHDFLEG